MVDMYSAVSPADLRLVLDGEVPDHIRNVPEATLRSAVFLASITVGRECTPPQTATQIMEQVMPTILQATGVEVASI